jgi:hypothetical protein
MKRSPEIGSSAGADAPGSALSAVAPHPVVNSAAAATTAAPNLSRLNIILSFAKRPAGHGGWFMRLIVPSRLVRWLLVTMMDVLVLMVAPPTDADQI